MDISFASVREAQAIRDTQSPTFQWGFIRSSRHFKEIDKGNYFFGVLSEVWPS